VLHVEIRDPDGRIWNLEWFPADPEGLVDQSVDQTDLDEETGELRLALAGGGAFKVVPAPQESEDDPPNWKLFTPEGLVLVFGPGGRWQFKRADEPVGIEPPVLSWLAEEHAHVQNAHMLFIIAIGLSIVSIAIAAASLALALH
jgi:hypothetical protein